MATAKRSAKAQSTFSIAAWRTDLITAATSFTSGAADLLRLAIAARMDVREDTAREAFTDAFAAALVSSLGVTDEEARASKSLKNRVSDAMAVFKAEVLPDSLPAGLQGAADACRKANPKPGRAPRTPKTKVQAVTEGLSAMGMLSHALDMLKAQIGEGNDEALSVVAELVDLAQTLAEVLENEA